MILYFTATNKFKPCKMGDTTCIQNIINEIVLKTLPTGLKELNLVSFEPLHADKLAIENGGQSPVRIKLYFRDINYHGIGNGHIDNLIGLGKELNNTKFGFDLKVPKITQLGKYKINGQVLILPIQGEGESNMTFIKPVMKFRSFIKTFTKNGQEYMHIDRARINLSTTR